MPSDVVALTDLPVPQLNDEQLGLFTKESIHAEKLQDFSGHDAFAKLCAMDGQRVLAGDFGGDKGSTKLFEINGGKLSVVPDYEDYVQGDKGAGYLESLQKTAAYAAEHNLPVGISWGGPLSGTKPLPIPKLASFISAIEQQYNGDFKALVPSLAACVNDSPAGLIAAAVALNQATATDDILFTINGGGLGMAVLAGDTMYDLEAGHVRGIDALNTFHQTEACGVYGADYVCIERFGSNKGGIEAQWQAATGTYMRARDIEDRYKAGDVLARELYANSALIVAHMIAGTAQAFDIDLFGANTAVVCHGGAFKFPYYIERIAQILSRDGQAPKLVPTGDFVSGDSNACLDGAAYAGFLGTSE